MCGKKDESVAVQYGENGEIVLPSCAASNGCTGKCKAAKALQQLNENSTEGFTIPLHPDLVINGEVKPFQMTFTQK